MDDGINHRPRQPAPTLLAEALQRGLERVGVRSDGVAWVVGERLANHYSTIFPIRMVRDHHTLLRAFYKVHLPAKDADVRDVAQAARTRDEILHTLVRGPRLAPELTEALAALGVDAPAYLAVDGGALTEVVTAIDGKHPNKLYRSVGGPHLWASTLETYRRLALAASAIEELMVSPAETPDRPLQRLNRLAEAAEDCGGVPSLELIACMTSTYNEAATAGFVYQHGDLGRSNVLVSGRRVGIIDFGWPLRLRGQDAALLALQLRMERPGIPPLVSAATRVIKAGYGDSDLLARPVYRFVRLWALTTLVAARTMGGRGSFARRAHFRRLLLKEMHA